jgi:hypothetical protein
MFLASEMNTIVREFGRTVTYRKKSLGTYNPATGLVEGSVNADTTIKTYIYNYNLSDIDGVNIIRGDRVAIIPFLDASGTTSPAPSIGDEIIGYGDKVSVVAFETLSVKGTSIGYLCQVRE